MSDSYLDFRGRSTDHSSKLFGHIFIEKEVMPDQDTRDTIIKSFRVGRQSLNVRIESNYQLYCKKLLQVFAVCLSGLILHIIEM